jgi:hypothetical protein
MQLEYQEQRAELSRDSLLPRADVQGETCQDHAEPVKPSMRSDGCDATSQRPLNTGDRFSTTARVASRASSVCINLVL